MCACFVISCDFSNTPLNIGYAWNLAHIILPCHHASYCALHHLVLICAITFLYVLFGSSRVEPESEQFEQEFEYHPEEDIVGFSTADLKGEPTSFTYFTVSCSLFYCYPYVAILLCHVSYSTCYRYIRVTPPRPTYCLLFASFASRRRV